MSNKDKGYEVFVSKDRSYAICAPTRRADGSCTDRQGGGNIVAQEVKDSVSERIGPSVLADLHGRWRGPVPQCWGEEGGSHL